MAKKKTDIREMIRKDLIGQLQHAGITGMHYLDLVEDYMSLWNIKNALVADIEERGVSVLYQNGANQHGYKKNDSIGELNKTNGQMLKILNELGIKPVKLEDDEDEEM